jgi:hypothetical protein
MAPPKLFVSITELMVIRGGSLAPVPGVPGSTAPGPR